MSEELLRLARTIEACAEDARRPSPLVGYPDCVQAQPASTISLANGLVAVAQALRAISIAPGIPIYATSLAHKGETAIAKKPDATTGVFDGDRE